MHIPTHILSGWCAANCFPLTPRERLYCMIAAAIPDGDGIGIVAGEEGYWRTHHVMGHNLAFGLAVAVILTIRSSRKWLVFPIYLACFHLHLLMDYFGSGPGWTIPYWWPFSNVGYKTPLAWDLTSWQNTLAAGLLLLWTIGIALVCRRTPLERLMPSLDRKLCRLPILPELTDNCRASTGVEK